MTCFDHGCGHGRDVASLAARGFQCDGYDPVVRPDRSTATSRRVNLGYVLNVIEDPSERAATLRNAWQLAHKLLVVSAQIQVPGRGKSQVQFGDGVLTRIGTFQKFYRQGELKEYLEEQLGVEAIPAALGVFYVFKDEALQQQFLASRYRRRPAAPRKRIAELRFEEHRELLEPLMAAVVELGRLPFEDEMEAFGAVVSRGEVGGNADEQATRPHPSPLPEGGGGKGDRYVLPERPAGCFAQNVPVPFPPQRERGSGRRSSRGSDH